MDLLQGKSREINSLHNVDPLYSGAGLNKLLIVNSCKPTTAPNHQTTYMTIHQGKRTTPPAETRPIEKLDSWLLGNTAPQPPPTTTKGREQVRLQGNTTLQIRTLRTPGDDEEVRLLGKETIPIQTEGEMRANTKIVKELLERKVAPQVEKQSKEKLTRVQELLLKFDTNPKVVRTVKTQAQVKPKQVETVMDVNSIASNRSI